MDYNRDYIFYIGICTILIMGSCFLFFTLRYAFQHPNQPVKNSTESCVYVKDYWTSIPRKVCQPTPERDE